MSTVAKAALPVRHDRATSQALRRHDTSFRASRLALHRVNYCNRAARHYKCISKMTKTENHGKRIGLLLAWRRGALLVVTACDRGSKQQVSSTLLPEPQTAALADNRSSVVAKHHSLSSNDLPEDYSANFRCTSYPGVDVFVAEEVVDFKVAADLRAVAFYEDLEERQALPFPSRFVSTFTREFAQRELRALQDRTSVETNNHQRCVCLVAAIAKGGLAGCLDLSERIGPCASQVNGVCVGVDEEYVYIDNVAVDRKSRRQGIASALLETSSNLAVAWGANCVYTHVHADNVAARRLYHSYGFRAPKGKALSEVSGAKGVQWTSPRLAGLVLLRAELPLVHKHDRENAKNYFRECTCGANYFACEECICLLAACERF